MASNNTHFTAWRRRSLLTLACAAVLAAPALAQAQDYPTKPVRVVVPFGAGGTTDALARMLGNELGKELGQSFVVDNVAGGSAIIGTSAVARAKGDGYTLLFSTNIHTINPAIRSNLPFDPVQGFTPIALVAASPNMLVVNAASPIRTVADYLKAAREKPGTLSYSFAGIGTSTHIAAELFSRETQTRYIQVPYNVSSQVTQALLAGDVVSAWSAVPSTAPFIKSGKLRALAVATASRTVFVPDVPTLAEEGVPGVVSESWFGLLAPADMPPAVTARLAKAVSAIMQRADVKEKMIALGAEPRSVELDKFSAQIRAEITQYTALAKSQGIKVE